MQAAELYDESCQPPRLTIKQFLRAFEDKRVELIEGLPVAMSPTGMPHEERLSALADWFRQLGTLVKVREQQSFQVVGEKEKPTILVPDIAIVERKSYMTEYPTRAYLVIEVADSSLRYDRDKKAKLYDGVTDEYWIVNLKNNTILVKRGTAAFQVYGMGGSIQPWHPKLARLSLNVTEFFQD
jgi:Uma2 family endonuclease